MDGHVGILFSHVHHPSLLIVGADLARLQLAHPSAQPHALRLEQAHARKVRGVERRWLGG